MIFLKLGGSLITVKDRPQTARPQVLARLASEVSDFLQDEPGARVLVGHGSGSFGHEAANRHRTHEGAHTAADWQGFSEVWAAAQRLNRLVVDAFRHVGLPAVGLPPSASGVTEDGRLVALAVEPVRRALEAGLVPIVYGDVAFDRTRGAAIVSTEEVFRFLAGGLKPDRILLAGAEAGVFADYPARRHLLPELSAQDQADLPLLGAQATDVTGGMAAKVRQSLVLVEELPALEVRIFSGQGEGAVYRCLRGEAVGTRIVAQPPG